jgi:hypothetical protein
MNFFERVNHSLHWKPPKQRPLERAIGIHKLEASRLFSFELASISVH